MTEADDAFHDIAIIGSGIACTSTLTALIQELRSEHKTDTPIAIAVIEKYPEMWKGIPYGNRSSVNALTISTLHDFFTNAEELAKFLAWFEPQKDTLLADYVSRGGTAATNWMAVNKEALAINDWNNVYLPRYLIGQYTLQGIDRLRKEAEADGFLKINTFYGEAIAVREQHDCKSIIVNSGDKQRAITAKKIVIAIGSSPVRQLTTSFNDQQNVLYINDLHAQDLEVTAAEMAKTLKKAKAPNRNVLIIGANASSIELLYLLQHTSNLAALSNSITVLSSGGKLPGDITYQQHAHQVTANLDHLDTMPYYTLEQLISAAAKDISKVSTPQVSVPGVDTIMSKTIQLLAPLDEESIKLFYAKHGPQLARIFRRSGTDYRGAANKLIKSGKLEQVKGNLSKILYNTVGTTTVLYYDEDNIETSLTKHFSVVVNCTGADDLEKCSSRLIKDLIHNNGLKINHSRKAFEVDSDLRAAPGIYVIGPLAGGNFNKLLYFWHLENTSRIIYLSKHLAKQLVN